MNNQKKLMVAVALVVIIIIIGVVAAGGKKTITPATSQSANNSASSTSQPSSSTAAAKVTIKDYMFEPMSLKIKVGDTVTWTNMDSVHHNVVADSPSTSSPNGPLIGQGESYSFKFTKAGTYSFHCQPHPYMHGTIVVE